MTQVNEKSDKFVTIQFLLLLLLLASSNSFGFLFFLAAFYANCTSQFPVYKSDLLCLTPKINFYFIFVIFLLSAFFLVKLERFWAWFQSSMDWLIYRVERVFFGSKRERLKKQRGIQWKQRWKWNRKHLDEFHFILSGNFHFDWFNINRGENEWKNWWKKNAHF